VVVTYIYCNQPADQVRIQIRCRNMVDAINRTGLHRANLLDMDSFIHNTPHAVKACGESDLLVIYRYLHGPILTALQYWKARDKKVVIDFDLAVNLLTENKPHYSFWYEGTPMPKVNTDASAKIDPPPIEQFKWGLALADAATVPSVRLVDDWSGYTSVYKVLDYINTYQYPILNEAHGDEVWIGLGNRVDFDSFEKSGLRTAMENVCRKRPHVRFMMPMENSPKVLNIKSSQIKIRSPRRFEEWVEMLLSLDIGLMPICGEYDMRLGSSDLLEFMISKIPWIASEEPIFHKLLQYGQWTQNTPEDWEAAILRTVDQLENHQKKAVQDPFLFALSQDLSANIDKILRIYGAIIHQ